MISGSIAKIRKPGERAKTGESRVENQESRVTAAWRKKQEGRNWGR
jgi:hypothetical protein